MANIVPDNPLSNHKARDVARMFGITLRQLQWWDETGFVKPREKAPDRIYSTEQSVLIGVLIELKRKGWTLRSLTKLLPALQRYVRRGVTSSDDPQHQSYVIVGGSPRFEEKGYKNPFAVFDQDPKGVITLCANAKSPVSVVPLAPLIWKTAGR